MDLMFITARKLAAPWFGVDRSRCPTNPFAYVKLEESGRVAQLAEQCPFNPFGSLARNCIKLQESLFMRVSAIEASRELHGIAPNSKRN
jgi:hypothetical protein